MKCIILLTFVAICYSYPLGGGIGRSVNINEDGTIVITQANGKKITINKGIGSNGQKTVDISVSGPFIPTKRIQINEEDQSGVKRGGEYNDISDEYLRDKRSSRDKKQRSQGETLTKILKEYQGDVDQGTYQRLLTEINAAVQEGQLSPSIYDVLRSLDQGQLEQEGTWNRQQGITGGQQQVNVLDLLRERAIEKQLQQQQEQQLQQLLLQQGQTSQVVLDVPVGVDEQGRQIVERVLIPRSQIGAGLGLRGLSDIRGISGQQGLGGIITGTGPRTVGTLSGVKGLLQGRQIQWGQPISVQLAEVIQNEREILDEQRQIQQQQLQQQQQQQELLVQQLIQQQQQQQQQLQQQVLQQLQEQQLREQERLLQQQNQQLSWRDILLNGGRSDIQDRVQQGLWQQQLGVSSQRGLLRGVGQGIPVIQRNDVPLIL